jgi:DNA-binding protein HU-beta
MPGLRYDGSVAAAVTSGDETSIQGFGKFRVEATPEREARNPATGAAITVAASKELTYTPGKALKDALTLSSGAHSL